MEEKWYEKLMEFILIAIGVGFMAAAVNKFFAPNVLAPGGVTGIAVIVNKLTNMPIYITNLAINIPLFIFGARLLGKRVASRTLFATLSFTLGLKLVPSSPVTEDLLLSAVFGGLLNGIGLGIVFKFEGTTGGSDLAGLSMHQLVPRIKVSSFMMAIDVIVVLLAGIVQKKAEIALYSMISIYVTTKVADTILEGSTYSKAFYIVTGSSEEVSRGIMEELGRGVTALKGKGMYTKVEKDVLLCVVSRAEFARAKDIVRSIDPKAFIMVTEMSEVLGEGFRIP